MKYFSNALLIIAFVLFGEAFANEAKQRSIYTDIKAHGVGDLVTVLIMEDSRAANKAKTVTEKKSDASTEGTAGLGPLDFIPLWGASGSDELKFDGKGQTEKIGTLRAKMTVSVIEVRENGDLVIEGSRVVTVNNEEETLFLTGVVRQRDIRNDNTIYSYQIADAQISSKSKGTVTSGHRPGFVTRLLNWIF
jgi:flagellar L-ring protein precursor FlgH